MTLTTLFYHELALFKPVSQLEFYLFVPGFTSVVRTCLEDFVPVPEPYSHKTFDFYPLNLIDFLNLACSF